MHRRPLVLLVGITLGDYLLWKWSLNGNHDVLALVSGLTLTPLGVACLWLLVLSVVRLLTRRTHRPAAGQAARDGHATTPGGEDQQAGGVQPGAPAGTASGRSSRKLAA